MKRHVNHISSRLITMQEHVVAFTIALFVVLGVGGVVMYRDQLFADITAASQSPENAAYASPLIYSIQDGNLSLISTKQFTDAKSLSFFLVFDPKKILFSLEKATSPYSYTYAPGLETMVQVTVFTKGDIPESTVLYSVPLNGSEEDVTIANAGVLWGDNTFETLAIQKK